MCSVHKLATRNGKWTIAAYRKVMILMGQLPTQEASCPYCVMRSPYPLLRGAREGDDLPLPFVYGHNSA